ncbi:tail fiber [Lactiplantibacillus plantarum]|nr:tail fiber [Lactiplantibacillus plantarum]
MAESNATQVILTDDGIKIIQAQQKAQNALTLANGKNKAYTSTSAPTSSSGYVSGDLWYVLISGIVTDMYYFDGAKWRSYLQDAATLNVGKLSALSANLGNVTAGVLHGVDIYGSSFYAGNRIDNPNNTAGYYPMTITPDGAYKSTYFDSAVGLQSSVESGAISYKYRSMIGSGQYLAYDSVINGQGFESQSGYTSAKDTTFSNPETITGYVNVTPASGIYLYGPTQKINFDQ